MDKDTLYWIFSTAAQTIAAYVGLLLAGLCFIYGKLDHIIEKDNSLIEIYEVIKNKIFNKIILTLIITGTTIIYDITVLFGVPYIVSKKGIAIIIIALLLLMNILTIYLTISILKLIMDPKYIKKEADNIVKDYIPRNKTKSIPIEIFIKHFIEIEKLLRSYISNYSEKEYLSLRELLNIFFSQEGIGLAQRNDFLMVVRLRNLVLHGGEINNIEKKYDDTLLDLTSLVKEKLNKNNS